MGIYVKDSSQLKVIEKDEKLRIIGNQLLSSIADDTTLMCNGWLFGNSGIDTKYNLLKYALVSESIVIASRGTSVKADAYGYIGASALDGGRAFEWHQLSIVNGSPASANLWHTNNMLFTGKLVDGYRFTNALLQFDLLFLKRPDVFESAMYENVRPPYPNK